MNNYGIKFTSIGALHGARRSLPLALSVFAYGAVFGVLARQSGMTFAEATSMSLFVYAGSVQLIILDFWVAPLPVITIVITTLVINLRYLLMGAALKPWFSSVKPAHAYSSVFFMGDEDWALSMHEFQSGGKDSAFLIGAGLVLYLAWLCATIVGYLMGSQIHDPAAWGLDFAFAAVFLALLTSMCKGKSNVFPWLVAAGVAIFAERWLPGKWYIVLGGLAGSTAGIISDRN